ncbi:MAG: glycosyltransferase family 2 protein [Muribaculaceae bacterium]|nr:glycosyltransferase family 2 protein [Muribaculaceae bacterium]
MSMNHNVISCNAAVAILMSTYNGAKYLGEQLDSLIGQTFRDWNLFIRDDGSNDNTHEIIDEYAAKDSRIHYFNDPVAHRGVKGSFLALLQGVDALYYMFCDQDDFWKPAKIARSMQAMKEGESSVNEDTPVLVTSDLAVVDEKLNVTADSMWRKLGVDRIAVKPEYLCVAPMYPGCTMLFNAAAKQAAINGKDSGKIIHDQLIALNVSRSCGRIIPIAESLILYRQHSANEIGARSTHSGRNPITIAKGVYRESMNYYRIVREILGISSSEYLIKKIRRILKLT